MCDDSASQEVTVAWRMCDSVTVTTRDHETSPGERVALLNNRPSRHGRCLSYH